MPDINVTELTKGIRASQKATVIKVVHFYRLQIHDFYGQKVENRSFPASNSRGTKPPCWRASIETRQINKELISFKTVIPFVCLLPVRFLFSSMAVLYHVNDQLQRTYIRLFELAREPGRDGCQSALWDCFRGRIFNMAANSSPQTAPQCTLTTISTRSPTQPQRGELRVRSLALPVFTKAKKREHLESSRIGEFQDW